MKFHGKLLAFLSVWIATVGAAFLLPNLEVLADTCLGCTLCEMFVYEATYQNGEVFVANGFTNNETGEGWAQAFYQEGGIGGGLWLDTESCNESEGTQSTPTVLKVASYNSPNWTCDLPAGAEPQVREFNGGSYVQQVGTTTQIICYSSSGS
jgi:hypothetical protein